MQINVTVEGVDLTSVIGEHAEYDSDGEYIGGNGVTIADKVAQHLARDLMKDDSYRTLKQRVMDLRDEEIRAQLKPIVEAAITGSIQRTNSYGHPVGEPTTLHDIILAEVNTYLTANVGGSYNKPTTTRIKSFVAEAVETVIRKEMATVIAEEKAAVVAVVRSKTAELLAEAVKQGLR